jgi:NAD(P)-dependent dehydrogenase (short-subunit alcohol dehydrogenase family)
MAACRRQFHFAPGLFEARSAGHSLVIGSSRFGDRRPGSKVAGMSSASVPAVSNLLNLEGRVALITGASGGIGAGIARRLHEAGACVGVHCRSDRAGAERLVAELGTQALAVGGPSTGDLTAEPSVEGLLDQMAAEFGVVDLLVNNAALQPLAPMMDMEAGEFDDVLKTNAGGVFRVTRAVAKRLAAAGKSGAVVNVASIEGLQPAFAHSHYSASKAAVLMHTRSAALELGPLGIRVNAVAPGLIDREGLSAAWPDGVQRWQAKAPLGRLGAAEDVADACLFLLSDAARWITGATLTVDGGMLTHPIW